MLSGNLKISEMPVICRYLGELFDLNPESIEDRLHAEQITQSCHDYIVEGNSVSPGPEVIKLFSCSTLLSTKFILLISVKMPTIVGILTFISMINTTYESLKAINFFACRYFRFYEQLKFRAQLS